MKTNKEKAIYSFLLIAVIWYISSCFAACNAQEYGILSHEGTETDTIITHRSIILSREPVSALGNISYDTVQVFAMFSHAQEQADRNEQILDGLVDEWRKYPDGKPQIIFVGYGSHCK